MLLLTESCAAVLAAFATLDILHTYMYIYLSIDLYMCSYIHIYTYAPTYMYNDCNNS